MTKEELIERMAGECGVSRQTLHTVVDSLLANIAAALTRGDSLTVQGFGSFSAPQRPGREPRHQVRTGAPVRMPVRRAITFQPSATDEQAVQ